jgi:hypothetical protein
MGLTYGIFKVPVIAVFTKFDQFKRNIEIKLEDEGRDQGTNLDDEVETIFREQYQASVGETALFVRLEGEDVSSLINVCCADLSRRNAYASPKVPWSC